MKNSLFIGNGLNRSINSSIEWGDLLQNIANEYDVEHNCNIALPLDFEIIANQISKKKRAKSKDIYKELKEKIADQIQKATLSESAPHYAFTDLPVDSIFTTNYDYLLESALDPKFDYAKNTHPVSSPNSMYNLITKREIAKKTIHHVHGELKYPRTMCLGYEHYAGTLQKMREALDTDSQKNGLLIKAALLDREKTTSTWAEKFFTDNIDIIGFGLDECEIDLWWLITYRASLFYSNRDGMQKLINNTITFHKIGTDANADDNLQYALENAHIRYQFHEIRGKSSEEYREAYFNIAKDIKKRLENQN